ncbi:unnamed protein product, partial [Prorocentrum cordatum]
AAASGHAHSSAASAPATASAKGLVDTGPLLVNSGSAPAVPAARALERPAAR